MDSEVVKATFGGDGLVNVVLSNNSPTGKVLIQTKPMHHGFSMDVMVHPDAGHDHKLLEDMEFFETPEEALAGHARAASKYDKNGSRYNPVLVGSVYRIVPTGL
ncbi:hypothetical protein J4212_08325 [Candidatus Woesearchaeota archaeon]|nr:hypothetical protein [Candidatus Woesearchaeota archaeon]